MPVPIPANDMVTSHSPAQSWSFRVPSPPRISVPPPPLNACGIPDLHVVQDSSFDFESSGFDNTEFLRTVTYGNFICSNNMLARPQSPVAPSNCLIGVQEWKYEQRRKAQKILPFLYLGPMAAARDQSFLRREGITMVLAVRNTRSAQAKVLGSKAAEELGIESKAIDVAGNQELIAAFPKAVAVINAHLSTMYQHQQAKAAPPTTPGPPHSSPVPGKVLVFCESGNERSATVVTAYIMAMYSTEVIKAVQIVQAQRFAVAFDDPLRNLLSTYEIMLKAKRDVVQADSLMAGHGDAGVLGASKSTLERSTNSSKRTLDDAYDEDIDMDGGAEHMDHERFERRVGSAPFHDRSGS